MPTNTDGVQEQPVSTEQDSVRRLAQIRERVSVRRYDTDLVVPQLKYSDITYLLDLIDSLTAERDEAQRVAGNLLARIFRDGGHRAATYETLGEAAAVADLEVANLFARAEAAEAEVKRLREALDGAYRERAQMVVALARMFPSWVNIDSDEPDWPVLYVQLPTGQASWHFSPADRALLDGITVGGPAWDGHTTEEKYARLAALATPLSEGGQS